MPHNPISQHPSTRYDDANLPASWQAQRSDEIDLFELVDDIISRKLWVLGIFALGLIVSGIYLALATSVFQVQARIHPPSRQDLSALIVPGVSYASDGDEALQSVMQRLASFDFRLTYWQQHQEAFGKALNPNSQQTISQQLEKFDTANYALHVKDPKQPNGDNNVNGFTLSYPEDVKGTQLAQGLLNASLASVKKHLIDGWQTARDQQLQKLEYGIQQKRSQYRNHLDSQKATLDKALSINNKSQAGGSMNAQEGRQLPLYLMGTPALQSHHQSLLDDQLTHLYLMGSGTLKSELSLVDKQINAQRSAKSMPLNSLDDLPGDVLISGLGSLKDKALYLKQLRPDFSQLKAAEITRFPTRPYGDIKPKGALVMAIGGLLGLMLGVFVALLMAAWSKRSS